ncbi:dihydrofolate reductase-like protein [Sphaerosporella brunnea]|uniref:Dihydrofolate reductase n=1 Tax=Sphaerosporella brunnea TaxID=1250544 RepID=A0A5J5EZL3_9PEZI|nr:dihydrofolate reductase-like protein [Sphaerosporella brunnea]
MTAAPPTKSLTLIVAATTTPTLGIGRNGALPWRLKSELAYFARVTKRVVAAAPTSTSARVNAVIMGRKTWFSIPPRFRPLPDRLNVVLSRDSSLDLGNSGAVLARSLEDALEKISARGEDGVERVFVIGGAEIYKAALEHPAAKRVLLTRINTEFEVDTFFPDVLGATEGWRKVGWEGLCKYVGEEVPEGIQKEGEVEYEYELWERE